MNRVLLRVYFSMNVVLLVLLAVAFPFIEPGTGSMVIAKLNALILVPSILLSGALIYREGQKAPVVPVEDQHR